MEFLLKRTLVVCGAMLLLAALLVGCKRDEQPSVKDGRTVFASNYPLAYFAERISGRAIRCPEFDGDPVFWEPTIDDIAMMQQTDIILINGATYEKWLNKISLPKEKIVNTSAPFEDRYISTENVTTHSHGPTGAHSHAGTAFTTWLDFTQAAKQAEAVKDSFVSTETDMKDRLTRNFEVLKEQLLALDLSTEAITKGHSEIPLFASHPVYDYFSRRYRLNLQAVLWEPDSVPGESAWNELAQLQRDHPASWMIWEDEPLPENVERLAKMGIRSIVFNPCGNRPDEGDFMSVMESNVENLKLIFAGDAKTFAGFETK
jgi:zinc transport system substrate-binding protein